MNKRLLGLVVGSMGLFVASSCSCGPDVPREVVAEVDRIYRQERDFGGGWRFVGAQAQGSRVIVEVSIPNAEAFRDDPISRTRDLVRGIACPDASTAEKVWNTLSKGQRLVVAVKIGETQLEAECAGEGRGDLLRKDAPPTKTAPLPPPPKPAPVVAYEVKEASADAGAMLYATKACNACHSLDGSRVVGPSFKGIWGTTQKTNSGEVKVDQAYVRESVLEPMKKIVEGYPPAMPPQQLNDLEIESLVLFIQSVH